MQIVIYRFPRFDAIVNSLVQLTILKLFLTWKYAAQA